MTLPSLDQLKELQSRLVTGPTLPKGVAYTVRPARGLRSPEVSAALMAPALLAEVIRLREALLEVRGELWESQLCNGGSEVDYLNGITYQAAETMRHIDKILGGAK